MISFIVAMDKNRLIGQNNHLPWNVKDDLQYFRKMTMGKTILMGRKTFDSIGRPLPKRHTIVLTHNCHWKYNHPDVTVCHDLELIIQKYRNSDTELMVAGGAMIFQALLPYCDRIYLSLIPGEHEGNIFFPTWNMNEYQLINAQKYKTFQIQVYQRKLS